MSRFNSLLHGAPAEVIATLEGPHEATIDELRLALINAFTRFAALEQRVATLDDPLRKPPQPAP